MVVADEVEIFISATGQRLLPAQEIDRLTRMAALIFFKKNYKRSLQSPSFTISASVVRAIMVFLKVNQVEFAKLVGCQKPKVSKILLSTQKISKPQAMLAMERLAMELARPGSARKLLDDKLSELQDSDSALVEELNTIRYSQVA